jgi:hypothetical protein
MSDPCVVGAWLQGIHGLLASGESNEVVNPQVPHEFDLYIPVDCSGPRVPFLHPEYEALLGRYPHGASRIRETGRWRAVINEHARRINEMFDAGTDYLSPDQLRERLSTVECPNCSKGGSHPGGHHGICNLCHSTGRFGVVCEGHLRLVDDTERLAEEYARHDAAHEGRPIDAPPLVRLTLPLSALPDEIRQFAEALGMEVKA